MRAATPLIVVATLVGVVRGLRKRGTPPSGTELRYRPPAGHDPAAVLAPLRRAGFAPRLDVVGGEAEVVVSCPVGERERVRAVLRDAPSNMPGDHLGVRPVRFADE